MSENKYGAAEPGALRRMNAEMGTSLLTGHSSNVQSIGMCNLYLYNGNVSFKPLFILKQNP